MSREERGCACIACRVAIVFLIKLIVIPVVTGEDQITGANLTFFYSKSIAIMTMWKKAGVIII